MDFIRNLLSNRRQVITVLIVAIAVLAIPVALRLVQQQQVLRSRASSGTTAEQCPQIIKDQKYLRPPDNNFTDACTSNGWISLDAMKAYLRAVGWSGDYAVNLSVFDAYQGSISRPKNCVARVQEDWRKPGAAAPSDMWVDNKNLSLGGSVHVGALDSNNPSLISDARIVVSGPAGFNQTFNNNAMFTPPTAGVYNMTAVGGPCNSAVATLNVTANCPDSCTSCFIRKVSPLGTYSQGGWPGETLGDCSKHRAVFDNWCSQVNPTACNQLKASGGACAAECANVVQGGPPGSGGPGNNNPPGGGGSGNYTIAGKFTDASGKGVAGVGVHLTNSTQGVEQDITTGSDGSYSFKANQGDGYAVRTKDNKFHAVGGDHTSITCLGAGNDRDVSPDSSSPGYPNYECQRAGNNDCAGPGNNGQSGRCNFTSGTGAGNNPGNVGVGGTDPNCTLGGGKNECPLPPELSSYPKGTATCDSSNRVTFSWTALNYPGKTVQSYELRINADPAGWGPDTTTPASQPPVVQRQDAGPDRAISVPANQTSITVQMVPGQILDWTARARFTDGTMMNYDTPNGWGHWPAVTCPGSGSQGGPAVTPPVTPTPPATAFTTERVKIVEDNTRNSIPEDDPIWNDTNLVIEKPYSEVSGKKVPFSLRSIVCVTSPCDTVPTGDRWVHVLFIGKDPAGNPVKKSESNHIYLALEPQIDSIDCQISSSGGTAVTINGLHFGANIGSVKIGNQNAPASATTWGNLSVSTTFPNQANDKDMVTLTTPEGQSKTYQCVLGKSLIDFTSSLSCRSVNKALTTANVEVRDASNSAVLFPAANLNFDSNGHPQGLNPTLIEGKDYKLTIQAPLAMKKIINFKATKGTTVLQAMDLPLGDIAPERADCVINSLDVSRLYSEWASNTDASNRRGDLNLDTRVNSLDYACMRSNFDKRCDAP